jgi:hypothetical protein
MPTDQNQNAAMVKAFMEYAEGCEDINYDACEHYAVHFALEQTAALRTRNAELIAALEHYADIRHWQVLPNSPNSKDALRRFFNDGNCVSGYTVAKEALNTDG